MEPNLLMNKPNLNIDILLTRQSNPFLTKPAPSEDELSSILKAGMRVPDHANLTPWRFTIIRDDGLLKLGNIFMSAAQKDNAEQSKIDKAAKMPFRAPLIIMITTQYQTHEKVPQQEQLVSAGCAAHAMQMAAYGLGFGGMWRTGAFSYHPHVKESLGVDENNDIVGFLYLGTKVKELPEKPRKAYDDYVSFL